MNGARTIEVDVKSRYRVNHALAIRDSLVPGAGIGLCPEWLVQHLLAAGTLERVLPGWHGTPQPVHLLGLRHRSARARAFMQFIEHRLVALPGFMGLVPDARCTGRHAASIFSHGDNWIDCCINYNATIGLPRATNPFTRKGTR